MNKFFALALLLAGALAPGAAHAYGVAGTVGAPYLELPMGTRGEGMGEAFTGVADDVNSIYYNPAGLTALDSSQLEATSIQSFGGIQYENIGLAVPTDLLGVNVWGTMAVSYTLIGIDDTPETQIDPTTQAEIQTPYTFTAGDSVLTLSYAWQATQMFSVGATIKLLDDKVATFQGVGVAGDVAVKTNPGLIDGLSVGVDLENFGTSPEPDSTLPTDLRMGLGYDWESMAMTDRVVLDVDLVTPVVPVDEQAGVNLGGEYTHYFGAVNAALRAGYLFPQADEGPTGITLGGGAGLQLKGVDLSLDYAWIPYSELGSMQRFSLTADLGETHHGARTAAPKGDYIYPPKNVVATGGSHSARVTWDPQEGKVDGYNIYMSYSPVAKQWTRLNKRPLEATSMTIRNLYNGYKVYFCVSTLSRKSENLYRESDKSAAVGVTPR